MKQDYSETQNVYPCPALARVVILSISTVCGGASGTAIGVGVGSYFGANCIAVGGAISAAIGSAIGLACGVLCTYAEVPTEENPLLGDNSDSIVSSDTYTQQHYSVVIGYYDSRLLYCFQEYESLFLV